MSGRHTKTFIHVIKRIERKAILQLPVLMARHLGELFVAANLVVLFRSVYAYFLGRQRASVPAAGSSVGSSRSISYPVFYTLEHP